MDSIYDYGQDPSILMDEAFKRRVLESCAAIDRVVDEFVGALRRIDPDDPDPVLGIPVTPEMLDSMAEVATVTARLRALTQVQRTVEDRIAELEFEPGDDDPDG